MRQKTLKMAITALCIAVGVVLPIIFHSLPDGGRIFLPMHIPVLVCGLVCGMQYGLECGLLTPLLSFLLTGMPPAAILPSMMCELAVYGLVAGALYTLIKTNIRPLDIYLSLIGAMLSGRVVYGLLSALVFKVEGYSLKVWMTAMFVRAWPGIAIQLVLIPILILALQKARLIKKPRRLGE
ncbi:MAG: ECF transporter S component [Acutalibacteraceae bacterium]